MLALFCPDQLPDAATLRALAALRLAPVPVKTVLVAGPDCDAAGAPADITVVSDADGLLAARYDARPGTAYLIRPDQHIAARWRASTRRRRGRAESRHRPRLSHWSNAHADYRHQPGLAR